MELDKRDKSKNSNSNTPIQDSSGVELKVMTMVQQGWYSERKPCVQERDYQAKQQHVRAIYSQSSGINHLDGWWTPTEINVTHCLCGSLPTPWWPEVGVDKILCIFPTKSLTKYFVRVTETEEENEEELGPAHDSK